MSIYDDELGQSNDERNRILYERLTGRSAPDTSRTSPEHVHDLLSSKFTHTWRDQQRVDTRAASEWLGVSQRTVQRWLHNGRMPEGDRHKKLVRSVRRQLTKAGRQSAIRQSPLRSSTHASTGATLQVRGFQGPPDGPGGAGYKRNRMTSVQLSPDEHERLLNAYADGGEQGFRNFITPLFERRYTSGWEFDSITDLDFGEPSPY